MINLGRLLRILWVFSRYRLDTFLRLLTLPAGIRFLLAIAPWRLFPQPEANRGERLRQAMEDLGPVFIKFGQILSTRRDLLPEDMAESLAHLQDRVAPFDSDDARVIVEAELGADIADCFSEFEQDPLASASVAQVHGAKLLDGTPVVVKVIRPGIERVIRQDIRLLHLMARLLQRFWAEGPRLRPVEVVTDYEKTIFDELDMQREAANASQLRRNFPDSPLIYVPEVYWSHTGRRVVTMERVSGIPIGDTAALHAAGVDMKVLAEKGVEIFFTQVFRDSFFHADMHPGNIFVDASNPADPQYIALDFGIVGTLGPSDKSYLARNLLAFFRRDYHQVAALHIQSGWIPADTRVDEFEAAIRTVCEPIFARPLRDISFGHFLLRLFEVARRFHMEVQPQLVLLQKTLLNVEGLGRQLYPDLDLWATAQPFLENWMQQQMGPPGVMRSLREHLPDWAEQAPEMPQLFHDALERLAGDPPPVQPQPAPADTHRFRLWPLLGAAACAMGALAVAEPGLQEWLKNLPAASWILLGTGGVLFWYGSNSSGH
ncbi:MULTISPECIES: ubiquinone biosynthesis regulatory protein kinase UbiB [Halomonadaceae]|uniref:Probable protein kinase UbiB n=1 Tax=Vreelandella halophila TaxID=86177 RepID=A0A9X4YDI6_9GAMM|nr:MULTISPECIES: ubiquinone biosynthesis regulatory protein kinase UbiB [Halomonas]MYL27318.1 ubiquinone biosynthesis regulatory protein kinase UbiB [Halomonas utahensis]MYL75997.1 ubiquinone biosynthesis regulatory protein kinase UbiB [Halomonas sp. 22501_18_FS]